MYLHRTRGHKNGRQRFAGYDGRDNGPDSFNCLANNNIVS